MPILHSNILGQGYPLVILHGFLGMGDNWKTLGAQFAETGYQVHLVDQRNHGRSFHHSQFDYPTLAADLQSYFEHHQLENAAIIGHSMGGKTAMHFATNHPQKVKKLVVVDIAPKAYPPHHQQIIYGLVELSKEKIISRTQADELLSKYIQNMGVRQFLLKNLYWKEKGILSLRFNLDILKNRMEAVGAHTLNNNYSGQTLFIKGENSEYIGAEDHPTLSHYFPKHKVECIPNAGHWVHAENPKVFMECTVKFLK